VQGATDGGDKSREFAFVFKCLSQNLQTEATAREMEIKAVYFNL
jgi:hypothetical protein